MFRSKDMLYLEELDRKIVACIHGASVASNTKVKTEKLTTIYATLFNSPLFKIVSDNFKSFGIEFRKPDHLAISGDFGNVSHRVPSFSFMMKTHQENIPWHSAETREGSIKQAGLEGMIMAAKVLAMSAIDIIVQEDLMERIKQEFTVRSGLPKNC
jgi:metal-dependent amidase/aminoacylase/carboxypeptidase family protein